MRAVTVPEPGGPEALTVSDVATPTAGPGEVLVAVHAAGVNRADLLQRQGHYPPPPGAPEVLGLECAGTVAEVGDGVDRLRVGEACVALLAGGGQAEYVAAPAGQVLPAPSGVDPTAAGGLMEVAATVVSNLQHASLTAGDTVLIHGGSGGIGAFAVQYARAAGATVLATAAPVLLAPAMHTEMWQNPATRNNVALLRTHGHTVMDPATGRLTGSDSGPGPG